MSDTAPTRRSLDRWIAIALFVVVSAVTLAASHQQGVHRDEAVYMEAGERYVSYLERLVRGQAARPFSAATVDPERGDPKRQRLDVCLAAEARTP